MCFINIYFQGEFQGDFKETSKGNSMETSRGSLMGHQRPNQESRNIQTTVTFGGGGAMPVEAF